MDRHCGGRLVVERAEGVGLSYALDRPAIVLGREEGCDVVIGDPYTSRRHAEIRREGDRLVLRDLGSRNGTFVNGMRIQAPHSLTPGDRITIGGWTLRFVTEEETLLLPSPHTSSTGALRVDIERGEAWLEGRRLDLTAKEWLALCTLAEKRGGLCPKEELAQRVWPEYRGMVEDDNIEQVIARLRKKLGDDGKQPRWIVTVRGLGYRLAEP
jgi:pSer/pThr/pTyr-binding forkhead associated (FHA) protein